MSWPTNRPRPGRHLYVFGVAAALVLTVGIGLWADIPGPRPDLKVKVDSVYPSGLTDPATNITIRFSNDLASPDSLNEPLKILPVSFSPGLPGLARWTDSDVLTFFPDAPLRPATEYRVTFHSGGGFINGNALKESREFTFRTAPLSATVAGYHVQRMRHNRRQARIMIDLDFNYPIAREQLRRALKITGGQNATAGELDLVWPDTTADGAPEPSAAREFRLATEPFDLNQGEQIYRLVLARGLRCSACQTGLAEDISYLLKVERNPKLDLWVERVEARQPGQQGLIDIQFSAQVPADEIREHLQLEPNVPFTVESRWRSVMIRGDFKPRETYTVTIGAGIASAEGTLMEREFSGTVDMGDLRPAVRFTSPGLYLPSDGAKLLELETVNIDSVSIEITQVFANNLVPYLATGADRGRYHAGRGDAYGRQTFFHKYAVNGQVNQPLATTVDVGGIIDDSLRGVFIVSARGHSNRWLVDSRHVLLTDIGIQARMSEKYLLVWANSFSETKPIGKARVKLFSRNNQLLLEGKTNSEGVAVFADIADQVEGFQPFLIAVEKDGELSYLRLDNSRLPTNGFEVSGRPYLTEGYEAFFHMDRGVFRPGETAHLVGMVRGKDGMVPPSFPYLVKITDPRGRLYREFRQAADETMSEIGLDLALDLPTGRYNVVAQLADDYVLGRASFLVEEFVPDRIKVTVATDREAYRVGETMDITVSGRMLYGPPAAGNKVSGEIVFSSADFTPADYPDFIFRDRQREGTDKRVKLAESRLSDSGRATYAHVIADDLRPPSQLVARVWASVFEPGGRAVSSYTETVVHPYPRYVGLRTGLDGYAKIGESVTVDILALSPEGEPAGADSVMVRFSRLVYNSMLRHQADGSYRYVSEETEEVIDTVWTEVGLDRTRMSFTPGDYGRYRISARDAQGGHVASVEFYASGWGRVPWSLAQPDRLQLDLDQANYRPGSQAKLQVAAPFGGRLLVTVENETVQEYFVVDLPDNTAEIEIPIERDYAPNVYVSATLIRPAREITKHTPARAYGLVPLIVIPRERSLAVDIEAPEVTKPKTELNLQVTTDGTTATRLTIAAVDAGILQLTDFTTPDPFEFFCGQRRPILDGYDLYSLVYPECQPAFSHLSPPGGVAARRKRHLNPFAARRIKPVSLWSGIVAVGTSGRARVDLDLPEFNGQLVIMAVAADGDRFGSATATVLVRDRIVIQESFPRFVAPGDSINGLVTVYNGLDSTATIVVTAGLTGAAELLAGAERRVELASNTEGVVRFPFQADRAPGLVNVDLRARAADESSRTSLELSNRPAQPLTVEYGSGVVTAASSAMFTLPDQWIPGTAEYVLRTSSLAVTQLTRNIEYLLRYPYGCVEQTTSALFPLLYFEDLARVVRPELTGGKAHEYFLAEGIDRLLRFQRDDGAFSYWPGGDRLHNWSSIYAAHFLIEAKLAGYEVDQAGYKRTLRFLKEMARGKTYAEIETAHRVYACLALAKAGKLENKMFNYLETVNADDLAPGSRYQLAAAFAVAGDLARAKELVPFDIQPDLSGPEDGGNLGSGVRTNAILLDLLLAVDPEGPSAPVLARSLLEQARLNRWYNTQSTAFALAALGKFFSRTDPTPFTGEIVVANKDTYPIDTADFVLANTDLGGKSVTIQIDRAGPCFYYWQASGVPLSPAPIEYDRGLVVRREYLDANGQPLDSTGVPLGAQLVGHISITASHKAARNVVINDMLPAGLEIENPRLANTPTMAWLPSKPSRAEYLDIRDDRLLLFVNIPANKTLNFYYGTRAIAAGEYGIPSVAAECMYNPLMAGAGSSGRLVVTEQ